MKNVISNYKSKDFYLIAVCLAAGCQLKELNKIDRNFVEFVLYDDLEKCTNIISLHWSGQLRLPSRKLIDSIHELKTRLHSGV